MFEPKPLRRVIATLIAGSGLAAGSAQATLLVGSDFDLDVQLNGSSVGTANIPVSTTMGGFFSDAGPPSWNLQIRAPWIFATPNTADINFNFSLGSFTIGDEIDLVFSDMEFENGEELTGVTLVNPGSIGGIVGGAPSFTTTADGFTMSFTMSATGGSLYNVAYDLDTAPPAMAVPAISAIPLVLLSGGLGLLAWRRRRRDG